MGYDKNIFINNVYNLANRRNLKIKDLETGCGVSLGYFSRLRQGEKNIAPGADFLLAVSEKLSVSVDTLLTSDLSKATESEGEMLLYIDKLIRETRSRKLSWQEDFAGYLDTTPLRTDGSPIHPLYTTRTVDPKDGFYYHTMFHASLTDLVPVKVYGSIFPHGRTLYLVQVWNTGDNPDSPGDWTELDLVMTGSGIADPIPLGHTNHERAGRLDEPMKHLFDTVEDAAVLPMLTPEGREIIRDYLDEERKPHEAEQK